MPVGNWNLEWLNHNAQRDYPLADTTTGTDQSGSFTIPDDFIVELDLPIHAGLNVDPARFFIRHIGAYATGYSIVIGYQPADVDNEPVAPVEVATALIARQTHTKNRAYALGGVSPYDDTVGKVVIGRLDAIDEQPPGFWTFDFEATRLDPDAVRPIIRGVSSVTCVNGDQRSARLYGDIELVAGTNCQLVPIVASGQDPIIRINFLQGEGTIEECVCEGDSAQTPPIKRISGVIPTPGGDFTIIGSDCMQIEPIDNGLRLVNTCAKPCCGCEELERITQDLERFGQQAASVEEFVDRLGTSVNTMDLIVLGAKLGDRGCITCE